MDGSVGRVAGTSAGDLVPYLKGLGSIPEHSGWSERIWTLNHVSLETFTTVLSNFHQLMSTPKCVLIKPDAVLGGFGFSIIIVPNPMFLLFHRGFGICGYIVQDPEVWCFKS